MVFKKSVYLSNLFETHFIFLNLSFKDYFYSIVLTLIYFQPTAFMESKFRFHRLSNIVFNLLRNQAIHHLQKIGTNFNNSMDFKSLTESVIRQQKLVEKNYRMLPGIAVGKISNSMNSPRNRKTSKQPIILVSLQENNSEICG